MSQKKQKRVPKRRAPVEPRVVGWICVCGERLAGTGNICPVCSHVRMTGDLTKPWIAGK